MHVIWIASSSKRGKIGKGGISEIDRFVGSRIFVPSLPSLLKGQPMEEHLYDLRSTRSYKISLHRKKRQRADDWNVIVS